MLQHLTKKKNSKIGKKSYRNTHIKRGGTIFGKLGKLFGKKEDLEEEPLLTFKSKNARLTPEDFENIKTEVLSIDHIQTKGVHPYDVKIIFIFLHHMNYFKNLDNNTFSKNDIKHIIDAPIFSVSKETHKRKSQLRKKKSSKPISDNKSTETKAKNTYNPIYIDAFNTLFFGKDKSSYKTAMQKQELIINFYEWIDDDYGFLNRYIYMNDKQFLAYLLDLISYDVKEDTEKIVRENHKSTCNDILIKKSKPLLVENLLFLIGSRKECEIIKKTANEAETWKRKRNERLLATKKTSPYTSNEEDENAIRPLHKKSKKKSKKLRTIEEYDPANTPQPQPEPEEPEPLNFEDIKQKIKNVSSRAREEGYKAKELASSTAHKVASTAKEVSSKAKKLASKAKELASSTAIEVASKAKDVASSTAHKVASTAKEVASKAKEVASKAKEVASTAKKHIKHKFSKKTPNTEIATLNTEKETQQKEIKAPNLNSIAKENEENEENEDNMNNNDYRVSSDSNGSISNIATNSKRVNSLTISNNYI